MSIVTAEREAEIFFAVYFCILLIQILTFKVILVVIDIDQLFRRIDFLLFPSFTAVMLGYQAPYWVIIIMNVAISTGYLSPHIQCAFMKYFLSIPTTLARYIQIIETLSGSTITKKVRHFSEVASK